MSSWLLTDSCGAKIISFAIHIYFVLLARLNGKLENPVTVTSWLSLSLSSCIVLCRPSSFASYEFLHFDLLNSTLPLLLLLKIPVTDYVGLSKSFLFVVKFPMPSVQECCVLYL